MNWKRLLIPIYVLPILWAAAVTLAVTAYFLQRQNPDYAILYTLSLASSAAFLAAWIAMWTYSFINRQSQNREFNRDIEVRYFEEIYGPLYEEVRTVADDLKAWGNPFLREWPKIGKSRFEPVIDQRVKDGFFGLSQRLNDYVRQSQPCWDASKRCIELAITGNAEFDDLPKQAKTDLVLTLQQDSYFLFDDTVETLNLDVLNRLHTVLGGAMHNYKAEDLLDFLRRLKPVLRADPVISARSKMRAGLYQSVVELGAVVLQRMKPFHET